MEPLAQTMRPEHIKSILKNMATNSNLIILSGFSVEWKQDTYMLSMRPTSDLGMHID